MIWFIFIFLSLFHGQIFADNDFQQSVDGFIENFGDLGPVDISETSKEGISYEGKDPVNEPLFVKKHVQLIGDEYDFDITPNIWEKALEELQKINTELKLHDVTSAKGQVTNYVIKTFELVVSHKDCSEDLCKFSCKIELHSNKDLPIENTCAVNLDKRQKRNAKTFMTKLVDPEEADVLANFAANTLDMFDVDNKKRVVKQIISANKQLSEGVVYNLVMRVAVVNCEESSSQKSCDDVSDGPEYLCRVKLYQSFENDSVYKLTQSDCTPINTAKGKSIEDLKRVRREDEDELVVGGFSPIEVNSDVVQRLANFSVTELGKRSNCLGCTVLDKVIKAESQVVEGINVHMKLQLKNINSNEISTCDVFVWERVWLNSRQLTNFSCTALKKVEDLKRVRRDDEDELVFGGFSPIGVNSDVVQRLANFSVTELGKRSNCLGCTVLDKVIEAESQVVAGINVHMKLQLKNINSNEISTCDVFVWEKLWLNFRQLTNFSCAALKKEEDLKRVRREDEDEVVVGGFSPIEVNSDVVQRLANFSVTELGKRSNCLGCTVLDKVIKAESQVVEGINVHMKLQLKNINSNEISTCDVFVWERVWLNFRQLTNFSCTALKKVEDPKRVRREDEDEVVVGGFSPIEVNSDVVQRLANFSVTELGKRSNCLGCTVLDKVIKAESQVVEGINVHMKLQLKNINSNEISTCDVFVWERVWLNFRQLTNFSCTALKKVEDPKRVRREDDPFFGRFSPIGVHSDVVQRLANFSVTELGRFSNCLGCTVLDKVIKAESQVVAGINVHMKLQLKNIISNEISTCDVFVWERVWLNFRQLTNFSCTALKKVEGIPGGWQTADVNNPDVKEMADFSLTKVKKEVDNQEVRLIGILSAKTQVVSGANFKIKMVVGDANNDYYVCSVFAFDGIETRKVRTIQCDPVRSREEMDIIVGGWRSANVSDPYVKEMADFILANNPETRLIEILSAKTQMVAGTNIKIKMMVADADNDNYVCSVFAFDGIKTRKVRTIQCDPVTSRKKRGLLGGWRSANVSDPYVKEMADFSLTRAKQEVNNKDARLIEILSAETQVVSGTNIKLTIKVGDANKANMCSVIVYDQSWTKTRKVTKIQCDPTTSRKKRDIIVGGWQSANVDDPYVKEMADFSLTRAKQEVNNQGVRLIKIVSAETQVVAGTNIKMEMFVGDANNAYLCSVIAFDQSWTKTREVTKIQCLNTGPILTSRKKRALVGGWKSANVNDTFIKDIADFSLTKAKQEVNNPGACLIEILSAETQVVSGRNIKLTIKVGDANKANICSVIVYDQPWTKTREVTKIQCDPTTSRKKRALVGGWKSANVNDTFIKDIADFSLTKAKQEVNNPGACLIEILSAETQVVSGRNIKLTIKVGDANKANICSVIVYDQPWTKTREVTKIQCDPTTSRKKRDIIVGGWRSANVSDPYVKEMADFILANNPDASLIKILSAETQMVAGTNIKIKMMVADADNDNYVCSVFAFDGIKTRKVRTIQCDPVRSWKKRGLAGEWKSVNVNDTYIKEIAEFSLTVAKQAINLKDASVIEIVSAKKSQVVAGTNIKLKLKVGDASHVIMCSVVVYDQPWTNTRKVTEIECLPNTKGRKKRNSVGKIVGAYTPMTDQDKIAKYAAFSLSQIANNEAVNSPSGVNLVKVNRAESQVVAGLNIRLDLTVKEPKSNNVFTCVVTIWERVWMNFKEVTDVNCKPGDVSAQ